MGALSARSPSECLVRSHLSESLRFEQLVFSPLPPLTEFCAYLRLD